MLSLIIIFIGWPCPCPGQILEETEQDSNKYLLSSCPLPLFSKQTFSLTPTLAPPATSLHLFSFLPSLWTEMMFSLTWLAVTVLVPGWPRVWLWWCGVVLSCVTSRLSGSVGDVVRTVRLGLDPPLRSHSQLDCDGGEDWEGWEAGDDKTKYNSSHQTHHY